MNIPQIGFLFLSTLEIWNLFKCERWKKHKIYKTIFCNEYPDHKFSREKRIFWITMQASIPKKRRRSNKNIEFPWKSFLFWKKEVNQLKKGIKNRTKYQFYFSSSDWCFSGTLNNFIHRTNKPTNHSIYSINLRNLYEQLMFRIFSDGASLHFMKNFS